MVRCSQCKGRRVQHAMWVWSNGQKLAGDYWDMSDPSGAANQGGSWCEDCNDHTALDFSDDFSDSNGRPARWRLWLMDLIRGRTS